MRSSALLLFMAHGKVSALYRPAGSTSLCASQAAPTSRQGWVRVHNTGPCSDKLH